MSPHALLIFLLIVAAIVFIVAGIVYIARRR